MRLSPPSSADRAAPAVVPTAVVLAGLAFGIVSEGIAYEWSDVRHWLPDLAVGVACVAAGAWLLSRRRESGVLLTATGVLWFAGNVWTGLLYAHRGPLVHLFVTYPGWRPAMRLQRVAVVTAYVVSLTSVWGSDVSGPLLAGAVLAFEGWLFAQAHGRARHDRRTALEAAAAFMFAVGTGAVVRALVPSGDGVEPMLVLYEVAIVWIAVFLAARLRPPEPTVVADLVVELGERRSGELRSALATALGDPTLEMGFWTAPGRYVDGAGSTLPLPSSVGDRVATFVERGDEPFAVIVHDTAVLDSPALVEAVSTATRLAATNVALSAELRTRLTELAASRRRLVVAADETRRRLATGLHSGVDQRVADLRTVVTDAADECDGSAIGDHLSRAAKHLDHMASDLHQLARGLHPRELDAGLATAVRMLAEGCPVPVNLTLDGLNEARGEVVVAAYYVCAEALTNVAKHAAATRARIEVVQHAGRLLVTVADDGCGGADPGAGSGLRGLADRVEALGGTLTVTDPPTGGTQLVAELPLGPP